jgi:hypothetical protein
MIYPQYLHIYSALLYGMFCYLCKISIKVFGIKVNFGENMPWTYVFNIKDERCIWSFSGGNLPLLLLIETQC